VDSTASTPVQGPAGSLTRRVAANTAIGLAGRATIMALGLASVAVLTRYLGPARYGQYGLAFSYTQLFGVIADVGLFTVVVREISKTPERTEVLVGNAVAMRLALSLTAVGAALGVALALPYPEAVRIAILIAGGALTLDLLTASLTAVFNARLQMQFAVLAQCIGRSVTLAAVLVAVWVGLGLYALVATASVGAATSLLLSSRFVRRFTQVRPRIERAVWRELLRASAVLGLALAINEVYFRADTIIISLYRSYREVGLYSFSYRVLDLVIAVPGVFLASVFPVISRYVATEQGRLPGVIQLASDAFVIVGVPLAAGGAVLAPAIIDFAAGSRFAGATTALRLLLCAGALISLNGLFGFSLIAKARQAQALWLNVTALALNLGLNFALVPSVGIVAAAAVTLAGEVVILAGSFFLMRRHFGFFPNFRVLPRSLLAAAAMVAVLWPLRDGPAVPLVALGGIVYLGLLWAIGGIDREALSRLRRPA
jgi:O-antigen/teichoic acid export membrane protein